MLIIKQFILAFISTLMFSAFFSAPKKSLPLAGLLGGLSWTLYLLISDYFGYSKVLAAFIATLVASILAEISAKKFKKPATIFVIPCLLPLVPGAGVYYTMSAFVNGEATAFAKFMETFSIAGAIAFGIMVSSVFSNSIKRKTY